MNFSLDADHESFRREVRAFIKANLPADMAWRVRNKSYLGHHGESVEWAKILDRKGWAVPNWPVEYGGTGWSPLKLHLFYMECQSADAPPPPAAGTHLVGPVLIAVGTQAQRDFFLPRIRNGEHTWCQGFSEPDAGSDLASLSTTAVLEGDNYVVNGQKLWTGGANIADYGFFLVRTRRDGSPQAGISFLILDMKSPGITIRPIITIDGENHVNEVFLDNVLVPRERLLGEENKGWDYAKTILGSERTMSAEIYWSKRELEKVKALARSENYCGARLSDDARFRERVVTVSIALQALEYSVLRVLAHEVQDFHESAISSALKIRGSELMQRISELAAEVLGPRALRFFRVSDYDAAADFPPESGWPAEVIGKTGGALTLRAATVFGGSREIQKNIVAKSLGL
jgi:alkylation response protein AidB-like acyl-CoA dehydrogenase